MGLVMSDKDEIVMSLVHYFITQENYTPVIVKGAKDEIWLENYEGPYRVVRINSNFIRNEEQYDYDIAKTKSVLRQIKRKTFSYSINILNIYLDVGDDLSFKNYKHMDCIVLNSLKDITSNDILVNNFKKIKTNLSTEDFDIQDVINLTEDVNKKTESNNRVFENIFKKKKIVVTKILIFVCFIYFIYTLASSSLELNTYNLVKYGANYRYGVLNGEWWRLFTSIFMHASVLHILFNMYALKILGEQIESYLGKLKFFLVFIISGLVGSLSSLIFTNGVSVGASGAIFGLLGSILYFGYHYRLVLGSTIKNDIIPVIFINLLIGFLVPGIDIYAHIGGLIGGILSTMALGVPGRNDKKAVINGSICLIALISFLSYVVFFRL